MTTASTTGTSAENDPPLVSPEELLGTLDPDHSYHPRVTILDVRWRLGGPPAAPDHLEAHLPGAVFVDLEEGICGPHGATGGRHPLPDPDALQRTLRAAGVTAGVPVVVYDDGDGLPAARTWWTLRWAGLTGVRVLDGGIAAWRGLDGPLESGPVLATPGDVVVRPGAMPVLDAAGAAGMARDGVLLDVRAGERYRGEREPIDPVAGHVPGALNAPESETTRDGRLLSAAELRAGYQEHGVRVDQPVGAYCGSGVTAAHAVLAMTVAGFRPALYVGSWSDWVSDPGRPVATGEEHA